MGCTCVISPSSEIIVEGAAIFTDMMETILNVLDKLLSLFRLEDPNPVVESLYRIQDSYVV